MLPNNKEGSFGSETTGKYRGKEEVFDKSNEAPGTNQYNTTLLYSNVAVSRGERSNSWYTYAVRFFRRLTKKQEGPYNPKLKFWELKQDDIWHPMPDMPTFAMSEDAAAASILSPSGEQKTILSRVVVDKAHDLIPRTTIHEINGHNWNELGAREKSVIATVSGKDHRFAQAKGRPGILHMMGREREKIQYAEITYEDLHNSEALQQKIKTAPDLPIVVPPDTNTAPQDIKLGSNKEDEVSVILPDGTEKNYVRVFAHIARATGWDPQTNSEIEEYPRLPNGRPDWEHENTVMHYRMGYFFVPVDDPFSKLIPFIDIAGREDFPPYEGEPKGPFPHRYLDVTFTSGPAVFPDKRLIRTANGFDVEDVVVNPDEQILFTGLGDAATGSIVVPNDQKLFETWYAEQQKLIKANSKPPRRNSQ